MRFGTVLLSVAAWFICIGSVKGEEFEPARFESHGIQKLWEAKIPLKLSESIARAYLVEDTLYFADSSGHLWAVNAQTGMVRWATNVAGPGHVVFRPFHKPEGSAIKVIVTTTGPHSILDSQSGEKVGRLSFHFPPSSTVIAKGDWFFAGGADAQLYGMFLPPSMGSSPIVQWNVQLGGPISAMPQLYGHGQLMVASMDGRVYSCIAANRGLNWAYQTGGPILGDFVIADSSVMVSSTDRSLYRIELERGQLIWRTRLPAPLRDGPVVAGHTAFQRCPGYGLAAVDVSTGSVRWWVENGHAFAAHYGDRDVLFSDDGRLLIVNHETGASLGTINASPAVAAIENSKDDAVYLWSGEGAVACLRIADVPYLRAQQVLASLRAGGVSVSTEALTKPSSSKPELDTEDSDPFRSRRDLPK